MTGSRWRCPPDRSSDYCWWVKVPFPLTCSPGWKRRSQFLESVGALVLVGIIWLVIWAVRALGSTASQERLPAGLAYSLAVFGLGDGELAIHSGGVVAREVADHFVASRRERNCHPTGGSGDDSLASAFTAGV